MGPSELRLPGQRRRLSSFRQVTLPRSLPGTPNDAPGHGRNRAHQAEAAALLRLTLALMRWMLHSARVATHPAPKVTPVVTPGQPTGRLLAQIPRGGLRGNFNLMNLAVYSMRCIRPLPEWPTGLRTINFLPVPRMWPANRHYAYAIEVALMEYVWVIALVGDS